MRCLQLSSFFLSWEATVSTLVGHLLHRHRSQHPPPKKYVAVRDMRVTTPELFIVDHRSQHPPPKKYVAVRDMRVTTLDLWNCSL